MGQPQWGWELEGEEPLPVCQLGGFSGPSTRLLRSPPQDCASGVQQCLADSPPPSLGWSSSLSVPSPVPHPHFLGSLPQMHGIEASSNASLVAAGMSPILFS